MSFKEAWEKFSHYLREQAFEPLEDQSYIIWTKRGIVINDAIRLPEQMDEDERIDVLEKQKDLNAFRTSFLPDFHPRDDQNIMTKVYEYVTGTILPKDFTVECISFMKLGYLGNAPLLIQRYRNLHQESTIVNVSIQHETLLSPGFSFTEKEFNKVYREMDYLMIKNKEGRLEFVNIDLKC